MAGVQYINSDDGEVDTELARQNMQKFINWMKNIQKGAQALREAQLYCGIKEMRLLAPVLTCFTYLIHSFSSLLDNKPVIEYMYGSMTGIHENIWERRPSLVDWEVIQMILTITKCIIGSNVISQCYDKECS